MTSPGFSGFAGGFGAGGLAGAEPPMTSSKPLGLESDFAGRDSAGRRGVPLRSTKPAPATPLGVWEAAGVSSSFSTTSGSESFERSLPNMAASETGLTSGSDGRDGGGVRGAVDGLGPPLGLLGRRGAWLRDPEEPGPEGVLIGGRGAAGLDIGRGAGARASSLARRSSRCSLQYQGRERSGSKLNFCGLPQTEQVISNIGLLLAKPSPVATGPEIWGEDASSETIFSRKPSSSSSLRMIQPSSVVPMPLQRRTLSSITARGWA